MVGPKKKGQVLGQEQEEQQPPGPVGTMEMTGLQLQLASRWLRIPFGQQFIEGLQWLLVRVFFVS